MANTPIPVSLSAFSDSVKPQATVKTPADMIVDAGRAIAEAYAAYQEMRALLAPLNGLPDSAPIPETLKIENIVVRFQLNGATRSVTLHTVQRVGDIYRLLALETERLVGIMRAQAATAQDHATGIEAACSRAQYAASAQQGQRTE